MVDVTGNDLEPNAGVHSDGLTRRIPREFACRTEEIGRNLAAVERKLQKAKERGDEDKVGKLAFQLKTIQVGLNRLRL